MLVKIIKAEKPTYWYASKIGKIVEVEESPLDLDYKLVSSEEGGYFISKADCVVLSNTEALQCELEEAKSRVVELEKLVAEERAKEAAKPFTQEQYEKVVAEYRVCAGRKKFEQGKRNYCVTCVSGRLSVDCYDGTSSAALFGAWFDGHFTCVDALSYVGIENIKKAHEYEMNIGL